MHQSNNLSLKSDTLWMLICWRAWSCDHKLTSEDPYYGCYQMASYKFNPILLLYITQLSYGKWFVNKSFILLLMKNDAQICVENFQNMSYRNQVDISKFNFLICLHCFGKKYQIQKLYLNFILYFLQFYMFNNSCVVCFSTVILLSIF